MSFLRQFLRASDRPSDPRATLDRDRPSPQFASNGQRELRVTLSKIRRALHDPEDSPLSPQGQDQVDNVIIAPTIDISPNASTVEDILHATRKYLQGEILAEQARVDSTPEHLFEKITPHPKGNNLLQFSTAEELRSVFDGSNLTIPVRNLGMNVDKNMMERIRAGQGPRPFKTEDLVEMLRLEPRRSSGTDKAPCSEETYDELLAVLKAWNMRVGTNPDLEKQRQDLLDVLESRCQLINDIEKGHQNEKLLQQQCLHLRQALHTYRPELKEFEGQDIFSQLIVMIANQGITIPDLDDDVRDRTIETLFREFRSRIYLGEEHSVRRDRLEAETERAKLQEDDTKVEELAKERQQLDKQSCNEASEEVRTAIKIARKRLCDKLLEELQPLTEQQAGQKWRACSLAKAPASALAQNCIESENAMDNVLQDWVPNIDNASKNAINRLRKMNRLGSDNSSLVRKLAGLDVSKAERKAVMKRRRNDPRTPHIMMEVASQSAQLQGMSQRVLAGMDDLGNSLDCVLGAARASFNAHDTLLTRVDQDDPYCTAETSYVIKQPQTLTSDGQEVVNAKSTTCDKESAPGER